MACFLHIFHKPCHVRSVDFLTPLVPLLPNNRSGTIFEENCTQEVVPSKLFDNFRIFVILHEVLEIACIFPKEVFFKNDFLRKILWQHFLAVTRILGDWIICRRKAYRIPLESNWITCNTFFSCKYCDASDKTWIHFKKMWSPVFF